MSLVFLSIYTCAFIDRHLVNPKAKCINLNRTFITKTKQVTLVLGRGNKQIVENMSLFGFLDKTSFFSCINVTIM